MLSSNTFSQNYLFTNGNQLLNTAGNEVRLTGVNWFGFETALKIPHGLWTRDYESMLQQICDLGFNCVRLPWSNDIVNCQEFVPINVWGPDPYNGAQPMNSGLVDKTPMETLDIIIEAAGVLGLKIILDNHSRYADGYMNEQLWYTDTFSEEQWIADWEFMAERYLDNNIVTGFDLNNEPHGIATWGGDENTDWKSAAERCANAIQAINPDVLIIIEGVENYNGDGYWWGGNLTGVNTMPVEITYMDKLVYSPHEYGPEVYMQTWFQDPEFPENMPAVWGPHFGFIMEQNIGHNLIGEFGILDQDAFNGLAGIWFAAFLDYIGPQYSWTYWSLNPNSGDTGGILQNDWVSVEQWKLDFLEPFMAPFISNAAALGDVDGNGEVGAYDAALVLRNTVDMLELEDWQFTAGDVDGNGIIQAYDAALILQYYVEIISEFPVENN